MQLPSIFVSFIAMVIIFFVIARGRRRTKCLENDLKRILDQQNRTMMSTEKQFHDSHLAKLSDYCRELEAKVQNRARLLELLIEELDQKLERLKKDRDLH